MGDVIELPLGLAEPLGVKRRFRWVIPLSNNDIFYATPDCTGQTYVSAKIPNRGRRVAWVDVYDAAQNPNPNTLYVSAPDPDVVTIVPQSRWVGFCNGYPGGLVAAVAVDPVLDLDDYFTSPLEVR